MRIRKWSIMRVLGAAPQPTPEELEDTVRKQWKDYSACGFTTVTDMAYIPSPKFDPLLEKISLNWRHLPRALDTVPSCSSWRSHPCQQKKDRVLSSAICQWWTLHGRILVGTPWVNQWNSISDQGLIRIQSFCFLQNSQEVSYIRLNDPASDCLHR